MSSTEGTTSKTTQRGGFVLPLIAVAVAMLAGMTAYQAIKLLINPQMTVIESNIITIIFSSAAATIAAYFVLKQRRRIEQQLGEAVEQNKVLLEAVPDMLVLLDKNGVYLDYKPSPEFAPLLPPGEFLGKSLAETLPGEAAEINLRHLRRVVETGEKQTYEYQLSKDGRVRDYEARLVAAGGGRFLAMIRDITDRKHVQEEVQKTYRTQDILNRLLKLALEDVPLPEQLDRAIDTILQAPFMPLEPKGGIFLVENHRPELTLRAGRNLPKTLRAMCGKVPFGRCLCGKAAAGGKIIFSPGVDERHEHRYEEMVPHGHYNVPIMSQAAAGQVLGLIVLYVRAGHRQDEREEEFLTAVANTLAGLIERKQAEEAVRVSEERYRILAESAPDNIFIIDKDYRLTYVNSAAAAPFGKQPSEIMSLTIDEVFPQGQVTVVKRKVEQVLTTRRPVFYEDELAFERGSRWFEIKLVPLSSNGRTNAVLGIAREITERKNAERLAEAADRINRTISSTLDFDRIMQIVVAQSTEAIGAESTLVLLRENGLWAARYVNGRIDIKLGSTYTDRQARTSLLAAQTGQAIAVDDAYEDDRVDPTLMRRHDIRSQLTVPLIVKEETIGSVLFQRHDKPVPFSGPQIDFARKLAAAVSLAVENARLYAEEKNIANTLQGALLTMPKGLDKVEIGYVYRSATAQAAQVGGDFYDAFQLGPNRVGLITGDVSGKGLQAAGLTSLVKNTIKAYAYLGQSPARVMTETNRLLINFSEPSVFVTVVFGILDAGSGTLTYCSAGHPPALLRRKNGSTTLLKTESPVIGVYPDFEFTDGVELMAGDDTLVLYTDGVIEARKGPEFFGENRLLAFVSELEPIPPDQLPKRILRTVERFTGGVLSDDIAILVATLAETAARPRNDRPS
jgi:PAS domain S-box-containing protein